MVKITIKPFNNYTFSIVLPIRITDINYNSHLDPAYLLQIVEDARQRMFAKIKFIQESKQTIRPLISDDHVKYVSDAFFGQSVRVELGLSLATNSEFDLYWQMTNEQSHDVIALGVSGIKFIDMATGTSITPDILKPEPSDEN